MPDKSGLPLRACGARRREIGLARGGAWNRAVGPFLPLRAERSADQQGGENGDASRASSWLTPPAPLLGPANSRLPVAFRSTTRALPLLLPFFAWKPSTVTTSPIFIVARVQPLRISRFGLASSMPQLATFPCSSSTSM